MAGEISKNFDGLPLGALVCGPLIEIAKGQSSLVETYVKSVRLLAYRDPDDPKSTTANMLDFHYEKPVLDMDGNARIEQVKVSAPLISLVPVPSLMVSEASIDFTMSVKSQEMEKKNDKKEIGGTVGFSGWGVTASITGSVSSSSENTRSTDQSAKYDIHAKAIQMPPAEGMAKLTDIFCQIITPVTVNSKTLPLVESGKDLKTKQ